MVKIFKTAESGVLQIENFEPGCWVAMTNPTAEELHEVATRYDIDATDMRAPLDEEERSRIDVEDNYTLILVDIPMRRIGMVQYHYRLCYAMTR